MEEREFFRYDDVIVGLCLLLLCASASAQTFEIKGYSVGVPISTIDTKGCKSQSNVDSGLPGYICNTTVAGDPAILRITVFEEKIVALLYRVDNAMMGPALDVLSQKYGRPSQRNRYIEDYNWSRGRHFMSIEQNRVNNGYSLILMDFELFEKAKAAAASKAKKDL